MNGGTRTPDGDPIFRGRRYGHRLRSGRRDLVETLLPGLRVTVPEGGACLDPAGLFPGEVAAVWLEVGFGAGEHLAAQAAQHPEIGFIGCEPFVNGVASLLRRIEADRLANLRVFDDDARLLLPRLAEASLGRAFVLFSDPWPKRRHHKRRFPDMPALDALAAALADGAELRFASDDAGYVAWALARLRAHPDLQWTACRAADWRAPPADWCPTRYEAKARAAGRSCTYLSFRRRPRVRP